tara:strand:- start:690 stop:1436 length:747 start_codon:yes stop_codon:yes gene_type:complete
MFKYYDNKALRKLVIAFGSVFNEIYVTRSDSSGNEEQRLRVPLTYSSKEKFMRKLDEQSGISDKTKIEISLPRMSFELASIDYDPSRHLNKLNTRTSKVPGDNSTVSHQEVPYNVGFSLFCYTRTMEDNLQILEQIVPQFAPEFIVSLNLNTIDTKLDVPIVLGGVAIQEQADGNFLDRRIIASSFNFTCKSRLYNEIKANPVNVNSSIELRNILGDDTDINELNSTVGATGNTGATAGYVAGESYES